MIPVEGLLGNPLLLTYTPNSVYRQEMLEGGKITTHHCSIVEIHCRKT